MTPGTRFRFREAFPRKEVQAALGVSRNTPSNWLRRKSCPNVVQAATISKIMGWPLQLVAAYWADEE